MKSVFSFAGIVLCIFSLSGQNTVQQPGAVTVRKVKTAELQNINEIYYFNNKPYTGISIDLFDDRTRMQEINWKNGILHGRKTEYFPGGRVVRAILNFYEGKRHGYFVYYHENGLIKLCGKYDYDLLDSTVTALYDNGKPMYIHQYIKGSREGEQMTFFKNGNPEQKVLLKHDQVDGLMISYYMAGNVRFEGHYKMGIRDGQFIKYHLTGLTAEESYYKDGIQDSIARFWDNVFGVMIREEFYIMGKKEGCWVTYNENGDTLTVYNYKNDLLNGAYKKYFAGVLEFGDESNGKNEVYDSAKSDKRYIRVLDEYGSYKDGKQDGVFVTGLYIRENHVEGQYSNGVMVGEWRYYNENDKLVLLERYDENGMLIYQKPKLKGLR